MRAHTDEFKKMAVGRVQAGEAVSVVAKDLGVVDSLLRTWKSKIETGEGFTTRKQYTDDFKRAAVARLANETRMDIAKDLGLHVSLISDWKSKFEAGGLGARKKIGAKAAPERRSYTYAYKAKAVGLVLSGGTQMGVARKLGISNGMLSNWVSAAKGTPRVKKKNYYVKVADRAAPAPLFDKDTPDPGKRALAIQTCIVMLKRLRPQFDTSDPVHLTAALVLATLEGKM
jgi:transposase-like protein